MVRLHTIFFASGSKGFSVRADGKGGHLARGYWFRDETGLRGPFMNYRAADRIMDEIGLVERTTPKEHDE
jgi:hypothetical protein